jgi:hypothetical protein
VPITGLNSQEFAKDLAQQAINYVPADLSDDQKNYVAKKVFEFSLIAGNHLIERFKQQLNDEEARTIVQFIGEWTFHKSIDIVRSGIPYEHWAEILQQVAFAALQTAIQAFIEKQDQTKIAATIEVHVMAAYEACIKKLAQAGVIEQDRVQEVMALSNVDKMAQEAGAPTMDDENKIIKYAAFAVVLKTLSPQKMQKIMESFSEEEQQQIHSYLKIEGLEQKLDPVLMEQYLNELKKTVANIAKPRMKDIISGIKSLKKKYSEEAIFDTISFERSFVINFMEVSLFEPAAKALSTDFSPYVAKVLYGYVKSKLAAQES